MRLTLTMASVTTTTILLNKIKKSIKPEHTLLFSADRHGHMYLDVRNLCGFRPGNHTKREAQH